MSPDARYIPARHVDANRVESYPYAIASVLPDMEDILPDDDSEDPIGEPYQETPEEMQLRLDSVDAIIADRLAEADRLVSDKAAEGERLIAEAEKKVAEAEKKVAEAANRVAEIEQRAFEEGYANGEREGRATEESQFKEHLSRLEGSFADISDSVSLCRSASEEEILALVTAMAEYLAGQCLGATEDAAGPLLRSIFEARPFALPESAAPGEPAVIVFMHPRDLEQTRGAFSADFPGARLLSDAHLSRGSVRIETADTVVDASFEKRRERLLSLVERLGVEGRA